MDNDEQEVGQKEPTEKRQPIDVAQKPAKFGPGNQVNGGRLARPRVDRAPETPEEIRALLFMIMDKQTTEKMITSLRRKIGKASVSHLEFLFDRVIGRPAVTVNHEASGALQQFIGAWQQLVLDADLEQSPPLALTDAEYREISLDVPDDDEDADEDADVDNNDA
jgi:hypothetical protein